MASTGWLDKVFLVEIMIRSYDTENRLMMNTKFLRIQTLVGIRKRGRRQKPSLFQVWQCSRFCQVGRFFVRFQRRHRHSVSAKVYYATLSSCCWCRHNIPNISHMMSYRSTKVLLSVPYWTLFPQSECDQTKHSPILPQPARTFLQT